MTSNIKEKNSGVTSRLILFNKKKFREFNALKLPKTEPVRRYPDNTKKKARGKFPAMNFKRKLSTLILRCGSSITENVSIVKGKFGINSRCPTTTWKQKIPLSNTSD